jgi:hypothetical protein
MVLWSLSDLERAIRAGWSRATCDPVDVEDWCPENPARGQCGVTALVLHDLLGGELLIADVLHADGSRQGVHYWNRLPGGVEIDLTREQFTRSEVVQAATVAAPPADPSAGRLAAQHRALATAVDAALARIPR